MAKDPAFLFYSSDFLTGVQDLTMEERGQYITLLCVQHQKGRLSRKAVAIAVPNATADVMAKFIEDENGLLYNDRLEKEAIKRAEHAEKQRQRALKGWEKRKKNNYATADAAALPLEDENEIENINGINNNKKVSFEKFKIVREKYYSNSALHLSWIRQIKLSELQLKKAIFDFFEECHAKEDIYRNELEYKSYCFNWIKKNQSKYLLITEL